MTTTTPISIFTGFLGAGKTTIISSLLSKLPSTYKCVLLKNEIGQVDVDTELAKSKSTTGKGSAVETKTLLNGCLCCTLVGSLKSALYEIQTTYQPDRIIIETSGTAFPAPIVLLLKELPEFRLDAVVTVVDVVNFTGYQDKSFTAKLQAKFSDLIVLNKLELATERQLDLCLDLVNDLNPDTPRIHCYQSTLVSPDVVFGLDSKLKTDGFEFIQQEHPVEVDVIQVYEEGCDCHSDVVTRFDVVLYQDFILFLQSLSVEHVYRVKGYIRLKQEQEESMYVLNWAFGRFTLDKIESPDHVKLTLMGCELYSYSQQLQNLFHTTSHHVAFIPSQLQ